VQRENREDTIVNQDGPFLLEAIRSGSRGVDDLTNYVESITIRRGTQQEITYTNDIVNPGGLPPLTNAQHIVALLSTPKTERMPDGTFRQNIVTARMRSISGSALEKAAGMEEFAFRYQVVSELVPLTNVPPQLILELPGKEVLRSYNLAQNLYEIRLTLRWPVFQRGSTWDVGRYRRTFRTLVSGELVPIYTNTVPYLYMLDPHTYLSAQ
jgi:hypothetical protein